MFFRALLFILSVSTALGAPQMEMTEGGNAEWAPFDKELPTDHLFETFKKLHGKQYESVKEEAIRRQIFEDNVNYINEHNVRYGVGKTSYFLGINQFTDLTFEEFLNHYTSPLPEDLFPTNGSTFLPPENLQAPTTLDWRKQGYVTDVKNQGKCGSCWAFSSTGSIEGQHYRKTRRLVALSEQQLMDCSRAYGNHGCKGGLMTEAFKYVQNAGGIESEQDYPYKAKDITTCSFKKSLVKAAVRGYTKVPQSEMSLKAAVASVGPVSVAIHVDRSFQLYMGGVYNDPTCPSSAASLNHGVLVVGYGTSPSDYWLVKNSWGASWGERGYIRMSRNKNNQCGIANEAAYPLM